MTTKWMSKDLGRNLARPIVGLLGWAKRKLAPAPLRVKVTRQSLMISLPASQGGRLHILPRPGGGTGLARTFAVAEKDDGTFVLQATPNSVDWTGGADVLAVYPAKADAAYALATLDKALTGNVIWVWIVRLFLAWLAWLFVTSYLQVSQQAAAAGNPTPLAGSFENLPIAPATIGPAEPVSAPAQYPSVSPDTVPQAGEVSTFIINEAKAAGQKAQKDALPPKFGSDNVAGLEAFGLKAKPKNAEGCDPKLAFTVPVVK